MPESCEKPRIALVGCGKMGEAILSGWLASDVGSAAQLDASCFVVVSPTEHHRRQLEERYGVCTVADVAELDAFDIAVLAVKPQVMSDVLPGLHVEGAPLVISIAAGIPARTFEDALPGARVVRVMPNMPLQVGMGASVVAKGVSASDADAVMVNDLFSSLGVSQIVSEDQIDAVCAISGGGPAYVAYMIEALRDAGVALGLDALLAEGLALQTVGGTWRAMSLDAVSPEDMRAAVCSPGGTTLAALASLDGHGFKQMYADAMEAAVVRAQELREGVA